MNDRNETFDEGEFKDAFEYAKLLPDWHDASDDED